MTHYLTREEIREKSARCCSGCGGHLDKGAKGTRCRSCWKKPLPDKHCSDCGIKVCARQNKSGLCRKCLLARVNADPELSEKRRAASKEACRRPEVRAKLSRNQRRLASDPAMRERWREAGKRNYHKTVGSAKARARANAPETIARRARTHHQRDMGWLPDGYLKTYHAFRRKHGAAIARQLTLEKAAEDRAARRAAMSPFERQMEALKRGASLTTKAQPVARDYDFTLGGVTEL